MTAAWSDFCNQLRTEAAEALDPDRRNRLTAILAAAPPPSGPTGEAEGLRTLGAYFSVPSHRVGIQTLNLSHFASPIPFAGGAFPLREAMDSFSHLGSVRFGRVWMKLIDAAAAAGVPDVDPARSYVWQRIADEPGAAADARPPGASPMLEEWNGVSQCVLKDFPMLTDFVNQVCSPVVTQFCNAAGDGGGPGGGLFEMLKSSILLPALERFIAADDPRTPLLRGEIDGILAGFARLERILTDPGAGASADSDVPMLTK